MAYSWTTLSATQGELIRAGGLNTALAQANDMYNRHCANCSGNRSGHNGAHRNGNRTDYYDPPNCSTHYSAFALAKCGGKRFINQHFDELIERIHAYANRDS